MNDIVVISIKSIFTRQDKKIRTDTSNRFRLSFFSGQLMNTGDRYEVEIRGCSIWAVEVTCLYQLQVLGWDNRLQYLDSRGNISTTNRLKHIVGLNYLIVLVFNLYHLISQTSNKNIAIYFRKQLHSLQLKKCTMYLANDTKHGHYHTKFNKFLVYLFVHLQ